MAFEPRHLNLQFNAALTDHYRLVMQQAEGLNFFFLGTPARDLVERVLQPLCHSRAASSSRMRSSVNLSAIATTPWLEEFSVCSHIRPGESSQKTAAMFKTRDIRPGVWKPDRNGNTLGDMARKKLALLAVCHRCKHQGVIFPTNLIARFGENFPAVSMRRHVRCSVCGCTSANLHEASR